jgi:hypothetical protein
MRNITVAINEQTFALGQEYAEKQHISFDVLIENLITQMTAPSSDDWLEDTFRLMDTAQVLSNGQKWNREELYRG